MIMRTWRLIIMRTRSLTNSGHGDSIIMRTRSLKVVRTWRPIIMRTRSLTSEDMATNNNEDKKPDDNEDMAAQ